MSRFWGIIPSAGLGTRIQPLAFSKELLPVGTRMENGSERPRAVSEYLLERMVAGGATHVCFVISPAKTDIMSYFGSHVQGVSICYAIQQNPVGLCDAVFSALPFISPGDEVAIGLPDTVWFPVNGFLLLPDHRLSFLLFPVEHPELFDAVITNHDGLVEQILVKQPAPATHWVWGAFRMTGQELALLHELWERRARCDQYFGTLVNAYLAEGGCALGVKRGEQYVDVGTLHGYREAVRLLSSSQAVCCDETVL